MQPDALPDLANLTQMILLDSVTVARRRRLLVETKRDLDEIRDALDHEAAGSEQAPSA